VSSEASIRQAVGTRCLLGESPLWHPVEQRLYWCDIPGHRLYRFDPASGAQTHWDFETDVASCAPMLDGSMLLAMRDGLWRIDLTDQRRELLARPPYNPAVERFNDGKCDPFGRFWVGTIFEPRDPPEAALYCLDGRQLERRAAGITVSNGLAWSPDGRTLYWSDTKAHRIDAFDFDPGSGAISRRRVFASFAPRRAGEEERYGGRPDGAAVDAEGRYWVAMFEGARVVCLSPAGDLIREIALPVQCPTMVCFGDADLRTMYITTATHKRPAEELAAQPWAGSILSLRVDVPGLPASMFAG
jgi:sugar lactone lactonase YvrE